MAVLGRGRGSLGPLTFCPDPPVFPPTTYYTPPHLALGGPAPQSVLARTATGSETNLTGLSQINGHPMVVVRNITVMSETVSCMM